MLNHKKKKIAKEFAEQYGESISKFVAKEGAQTSPSKFRKTVFGLRAAASLFGKKNTSMASVATEIIDNAGPADVARAMGKQKSTPFAGLVNMKKNVKKNISSFFDRMTHNAAAAEGMGTFMKLKNVVDKMHGNRFADNVRALWRKPQATKIQTLNKQIAEVTEKLNLKE